MTQRQTTYPSRKIVLADMPEVTSFSSEFRYNFYLKNEIVSSAALEVPNGFYVDGSQLANVTPVNTAKYDRFVARYNLLQWKTVALPSSTPNEAFEQANNNVILQNLQSIYSETDLTLDEYSVISFKDDDIDGKTKMYAELMTANEAFGLGISASLDEGSLQEISKNLNDATPDQISLNFLSDIINQPKDYGVTFYDSKGFESFSNTLVNEIKDVEVRSTLNNRFIHDIVKSSIDNPNSFYGDELATIASTLQDVQKSFRTTINPSIVSGKDYDFEVDNVIDYRVVNPNESIPGEWTPGVFCTGYLIEKYERQPDGTVVLVKTDSVENPSQGYYFDNQVKYGDRITYAIYSVFVAQTYSTYPTTGEKIVIRFLVKSRPKFTTVLCTEEISPPPPADFSISWNYDTERPTIYWSMPLNKQRDIKFFKIYRRNKITEPFELMRIFDFNDLEAAPDYNMPQYYIDKFNSPETLWVDHSFTKDSQEAIYAVVSVDAHGFISNYSQQLKIRFNKVSNVLEVNHVATEGAPIPYPNMTLDKSMFVDTMRTSGSKKLKIYFDPEYYNVTTRQPDGKIQDLNLITTDKMGKYTIQFINVDLQEQGVVNLSIQDNRIKPNIIQNIQDVPPKSAII